MSMGMVYSLAAPAPAITVVASGLENPRGLVFGPDRKLYVAEGGLGGTTMTTSQQCPQVLAPVGPYSGGMTSRISKVDAHSGRRTTVIDGLPSDQTSAAAGSLVSGVSDVAFVGRRLYAITAGSGCSHGLFGTSNAVLRIDREDHKATQVADLSHFLATHPVANPNGPDFEPDGTWYSMISVGENLYAVEPNHGEIDRITEAGHVSRVVDVSATQGHIVPTGLASDHGRFDLVNLNVFDPGAQEKAGLFHVTRHGNINSVASGLTAAVDVAVHDGDVYALEAFTGFFAPTPLVANTGTVVRLGKSGAWEIVATGLSFPTAMTFGPDGDLYVSNKGFGQPTNTAGEIVRIELPGEERDDN